MMNLLIAALWLYFFLAVSLRITFWSVYGRRKGPLARTYTRHRSDRIFLFNPAKGWGLHWVAILVFVTAEVAR